MKASSYTKMNSSLGHQTDFITQGDILIIDGMEGGKIKKYILYIYIKISFLILWSFQLPFIWKGIAQPEELSKVRGSIFKKTV